MSKIKVIVCLLFLNLFSFKLLYCMDDNLRSSSPATLSRGSSSEELQARARARAERAGQYIGARSPRRRPVQTSALSLGAQSSASCDVLPGVRDLPRVRRNAGSAVARMESQSASYGALPHAESIPVGSRARDLREGSRRLLRTSGGRRAADDSASLTSSGDTNSSLLEQVAKLRRGKPTDDKAGSKELARRPLGDALDSVSPQPSPPAVIMVSRRRAREASEYRDSLLEAENAAELKKRLNRFYRLSQGDGVPLVEDELLKDVVTQIRDGDDEHRWIAVDKLRVIIEANKTRDNALFRRQQIGVLRLLFTCEERSVQRLTTLFTRELDSQQALALLEPFGISEEGRSFTPLTASASAAADGV